MNLLARKLGDETNKICERLTERALDGDTWTRMKLPTSLGGMGIREVTSQLEISYDVTKRKTAQQSERTKNLTGKRTSTHTAKSMKCGTARNGRTVQVGPCECCERKRLLFVHQPNLERVHEITTAHRLWSEMDTHNKAAFSGYCGTGVGVSWTETSLEQGMPDDEWKTGARRRLRLRIGEARICECGAIRDQMGDHILTCQQSPWRTRIPRQSSRLPFETAEKNGCHG